jgi:hypothetical protein
MFNIAQDVLKAGINYLKTMDLNHDKIPDLQELQTKLTAWEAKLAPIVSKITATHVLQLATEANQILGNPLTATEINTAISVGGEVVAGIKQAAGIIAAVK